MDTKARPQDMQKNTDEANVGRENVKKKRQVEVRKRYELDCMFQINVFYFS